MILFYLIACIPVAIGGYLYYKNKEILWQEWVIGSIAAFILAGIIHTCAYFGLTEDYEMWSGQVTSIEHHPRWVEEYQQMRTRQVACGRDSNGNTKYRTETYYTIEHDTHPEHWLANRSFGSAFDAVEIGISDYNRLFKLFGSKIVDGGKQSTHHGGHRYSGDNQIYTTKNDTRYVEPTTKTFYFENRIKAAPSVFSFTEVPKEIEVFEWPTCSSLFKSDRLLGTACNLIDIYKWDCMNSDIGPNKLCNVIMVGFGRKGSEYGQWQEAKWIGGKKNDIVICFGGGGTNKSANWCYVFGWTEKEIVKKNIETILLNNSINDNIIKLIKSEIYKNYELKDWSKFDYIQITIPSGAIWIFIILLGITQFGLWIFFHRNEWSKGRINNRYRRA